MLLYKILDFVHAYILSLVGITKYYGLDGRGQDFSLFHSVQTGSGAHPASYPMSTGASFPRGIAAGA
jgi:hypothetical protein